MIEFQSTGSFKNTEAFLKKMSSGDIWRVLDQYGRIGQDVLASATPVDSGETAAAWKYQVKSSSRSHQIIWTNGHVVDGRPVAILLQYGHGTGTGGYVQGRDYINPAIKPVFDKIAESVWKAVTSA